MSAAVLLSAVLQDVLRGEPGRHPVHAMGRTIRTFRQVERTRTPAHRRLRGATFAAAGALCSAFLAWLADRFAQRAPRAWQVSVSGVLLKPTFAIRDLMRAAQRVQHALERNDLEGARYQAGRHLVSRPTEDLSAAEVAGAAIESVAENLTDSIVSPIAFYALGGLPAANAYRFINTADAMIGYRTPELEQLGWASARLDDLVNYIPARMAALSIVMAAQAGGGSPGKAWRIMMRDARRTASPNAGWTMAAMAGALGVRLSKRGAYTLNDRAREPQAADVGRAIRITLAATALCVTVITSHLARAKRT